MLNGDKRYIRLVSKPFMGIRFAGSAYGVVVIRPKRVLTPEAEAALSEMVEDLSDNELHMYFVTTRYEGYYAVMISAEEQGAVQDAVDNAVTLFSEQFPYRLGVSPCFEDLQTVQEAFLYAFAICGQSSADDTPRRRPDANPAWQDDEEIERLLQSMYTGNVQSALTLLNAYIDKAKRCAGSPALEQVIFHNLLFRLNALARENNVNVGFGLIESVIHSVTREDMVAHFGALVRFICESLDGEKQSPDTAAAPGKSPKRVDDVLQFIDDNYRDSNMSLDLLSAKYNLSTRYISNIIKEETGMSYKDYLTRLRIRRAQEMLLSKSITVAAACEHVGYTNLPHFIKVFKQITGFTPSSYSQRRYQNEQKSTPYAAGAEQGGNENV